MLAVPISFVSEHIETLEEIDMEYRELAEESGIEHWRRVPALNTNPVFINDLADAGETNLPSSLSIMTQDLTQSFYSLFVTQWWRPYPMWVRLWGL